MVYYVNDHLIQDEVASEGTWVRDGKEEQYKRIMISTAPGATRRQEDGSFTKISRTICAHSCSLSSTAKTRIVNIIPDGSDDKVRVSIRTSENNRYDSDVFIVALPYDGLIMPMEAQENLAIFRFMILKSDQTSIEHEDHKYRRAIYFVVSPKAHLDADGWYPESCDLVVKTIRSNASKKMEDTSGCIWTITTHRVRFGEAGAFEISVEDETVPYEDINPEDLRNTDLCTLEKAIRFGENKGGNRVYSSTGKRSDGTNTTTMRASFEKAGYGDMESPKNQSSRRNKKKRHH